MPSDGIKSTYLCEGTEFQGFTYHPETTGQAPCVIVAHAWMGQDDFARQKAKELAALGYVGFAADVYGNGTCVTTPNKALELMTPLFLDRKILRKRIVAAVEAVKNDPRVDPKKIGAIGFCFGGQTVLELLRSGCNVQGVVSFHGVLGNNFGEKPCKLEPNSTNIKASCLVLHGHDDPLVSPEDVVALENELTSMNIDWQVHVFGKTMHAFTNPQANDPASGLVYNPVAEKRSWHLMKEFFKEVFV